MALIDPLAVDIAPLASSFDSDGIAVVHAAQQDLEVLDSGVRHRAAHPVRHPARCGLRRATARPRWPTCSCRAGGEASQRRPPHRLARRPLSADQCGTPRRRRAPARAARSPRRPARRQRAVSTGRSTSAKSCARGRPAPPNPSGPGCGSKTTVTFEVRAAAWPRRSRRGGSAGRRRSTSRFGSCCPTSRSSASRSGHRPISTPASRPWPRRAGTARSRSVDELLDAVRRASSSTPRRSRRPTPRRSTRTCARR